MYSETGSIHELKESHLFIRRRRYRSFQIIHADERFLLSMLLLPATCIGADVALKYWWRQVRRPDPVNALRYQLQERGARAATPAEVVPEAKRQQEQERRKVTAEQHRVSFAAQSKLRHSSGHSASSDNIRPGISSSVLGRDDNESNRRGAHITFGRGYLLPQETAAAVESNQLEGA